MSNRPWRVKPREIFRTIKTVQQTGLPIRNVEIGPDGLIRVNVGEAETALAGEFKPEPSEWD
ncbi:hypothetical protein [Bradyrhizobium sp. Ash2021]|uniref:hypothetical protein n=1 Tax=Bradyrhizobium sp. Ash2021 TaxID=2954771 RepID=UPI002814E7BE|nr:hypothetical protein [Bradyrhizobium sp. Ash2021]WMT78824.1 hypothetical protein NL528_21860 [Bradyrhizobium sp. Ash2021]